MDQRTVQIGSMPWLVSLERQRGVADVREVLAARHPAFTGTRLQDLAIVGAAEEGRRLFALCAGRGIAVRAVVEYDSSKHGMRLGSHEVSPPWSL